MKKYLPKLIFFLWLVILILPLTADGQIIEITNPLKAQNFTVLLNVLIDFIFYFAIGIAPIMIIIAGFYFITAAGEPAKIQTAKKIILYTLIGLLVVFCAKGLIKVFREIFGVLNSPI